MIISTKYKYLFIETPHTGSTAISKELIENYSGKTVLHKHANYHEFLRIATPDQKKYFVFAGVRNPLDEAVSLYYKFLTNHKSNYTSPDKLLKNGGWVTQRKVDIYNQVQIDKDFNKFLRMFYKVVYTNNININKNHCDYILRFENLDSDFSTALKAMGIDKKRPLPLLNKTKKSGEFVDYYTDESIPYALNIFGPFMTEWGYNFPAEWGLSGPPLKSSINYKLGKVARVVYSRYVKSGPLQKVTKIRDALE